MTAPQLFFVFHDLDTFFIATGHLFSSMSSHFSLLMSSQDQIEVILFWQDHHRSNVVPSVHHSSRFMKLIHLFADYIQFDHFVKVIPTGFLQTHYRFIKRSSFLICYNLLQQ